MDELDVAAVRIHNIEVIVAIAIVDEDDAIAGGIPRRIIVVARTTDEIGAIGTVKVDLKEVVGHQRRRFRNEDEPIIGGINGRVPVRDVIAGQLSEVAAVRIHGKNFVVRVAGTQTGDKDDLRAVWSERRIPFFGSLQGRGEVDLLRAVYFHDEDVAIAIVAGGFENDKGAVSGKGRVVVPGSVGGQLGDGEIGQVHQVNFVIAITIGIKSQVAAVE